MVELTEQVSKALDEVMDPHMNVGLNDMGMITRIDVDDNGGVDIGMVFPCIGCPAWKVIQDNMKKAVSALTGVTSVVVKVEWDKPWEREDMSDHAREHAQTHGYRI